MFLSILLMCLQTANSMQSINLKANERTHITEFEYNKKSDDLLVLNMDQTLFQACREDRDRFCKDMKPGVDERLYRCLVKHYLSVNYPLVSSFCSAHVKEAIHRRNNDIRLMPAIEKPCMADLGKLCTVNHQKGEKIDCLQNNYDHLHEKCKAAIKEFTVVESKNFDLNTNLVNKCGKMVTKFCEQELKDKDGKRILPCLTSKKNDIDMDFECANALEHWQLIEMKDFEFSPALKEMCYEDIYKLCRNLLSKSKFEAVKCLSQRTAEDSKQVSAKCRKQIRRELMVQSENIQLNPEILRACKIGIATHCAGVPPGGAQIEECLRRNFRKLRSKDCKILLFKQEEIEAKDVEVDYRLMQVCRPMIKNYCHSLITSDSSSIMECLRAMSHDPGMSRDCRDIVVQRQKEQASSFVLDAEMSQFCKPDVQRHCLNGFKEAQKAFDQGYPDEGIVFGCLVDVMIEKKKRLQPSCEQYVRRREREAALELDLNRQFLQACRDEMEKLCSTVSLSDENVIDCMKMNILKIKSKRCVKEVRTLIMEGIEDVHIDPFLEEACARDINSYCGDLPKKSGNVVFCLIDVHKAKNLFLQSECDNFVTKRIQLYTDSQVDTIIFDSTSQITDSPKQTSDSVFMTIIVIVTGLFIGGIVLRRTLKRAFESIKL